MTTASPRFDPLRVILISAGVFLFLSFGYTEMAGSDLWWHLAAGRELVQTGTIWMVDDWSYSTHGGDWLNHEWLADLVYYGWYSAFGLSSLVYWKWLVVLGTFCLLQYVLYRETGDLFASLVGASVAAAIAAPFVDVRPHLYTLLGYSLLLCLAWNRKPSRWLLAMLFLVWVNLHGGFFFGLMALGILIFPWRNFSWSAFRVALLTGLLCVAVSALNPSGLKTFLYPLIYAFDSSSPYRELGEWHSPFREGGIRSPLFFVFMWAPLAGLLYGLPAVRRKVDVPWEALLLTALTLAMAITSRRFIPIFGISLALWLTPLVALAMRQVTSRAVHYGLATAALIFSLYRLMPYPLQSAPAFHYLTAEYSYPDDMVTFMQVNNLAGKVYSFYNWGGYLHLRTDGALKVFIDGRADTVYSAETYYHYLHVLSGKPGWIDAIESSGAEFVLWPVSRRGGDRMLRELTASGRWRPLYQSVNAWLAIRSDIPLPDEPQLPPDSAIRNVTLAMQAARLGQAEKALEFVVKARTELPWHKTACQLQVNLLRNMQQPVEAHYILQECRGYFPSALLR